jgi:hypothetical protein
VHRAQQSPRANNQYSCTDDLNGGTCVVPASPAYEKWDRARLGNAVWKAIWDVRPALARLLVQHRPMAKPSKRNTKRSKGDGERHHRRWTLARSGQWLAPLVMGRPLPRHRQNRVLAGYRCSFNRPLTPTGPDSDGSLGGERLAAGTAKLAVVPPSVTGGGVMRVRREQCGGLAPHSERRGGGLPPPYLAETSLGSRICVRRRSCWRCAWGRRLVVPKRWRLATVGAGKASPGRTGSNVSGPPDHGCLPRSSHANSSSAASRWLGGITCDRGRA